MAGQQEPVIWMRPQQAAVGRPAERSRAEITAAAVALADAEGLEAVSMRRVATSLGTGAATLYRYVSTRDDLLDLMIDSTAGEYDLPAPSGDWPADLLTVARQAQQIMRRHPWLPALVITRPALGPAGIDLLEHVLDVLADHPAAAAAKLEAFALLMALTALFTQNELAGAGPDSGREAAYLHHVAAAGSHPRLAALLAAAVPPRDDHRDQLAAVLGRVLSGLLG
ncbi:TetR/AcrR family transcriptional regulator [Kitasatospora kifunensis]|uniref:AcrR family transcriptional regulator n=1 Tax=Kitasatospora kifunensis TaxID=58351 RepID=A0A7W7R3X6_KITKI|nr:TetR/AcrR family transcriptional regulator [Kitasatospora kifunensis]MBB4924728.1 AcrR family transcriptional regulator [Kitasatospora kifunensis]